MTKTPRRHATRTGLVALWMLVVGVTLGGCPSGDAPETAPPTTPDDAPAEGAREDAAPSDASAAPGEADTPGDERAAEPPETDVPLDDPVVEGPEEEVEGADATAPEEPTESALDFQTRVDRYMSIDEAVLIESDGPLVHAATGLTFPKHAAEFVRLQSKRYDADGHDLGIGYTRMWRSAIATVTVYVYPRALVGHRGALEEAEPHLDAVLTAVRQRHDDVEETGRATGTASLHGTAVTFASAEVEHRGGPEHFGRKIAGFSSAVAAQSWWVKLRVTTPVENRDTALAAVEKLLAELGLPPTGLPVTRTAETDETSDQQ